MTSQTIKNDKAKKAEESALTKRVKALDDAIQKATDANDKEKIEKKDLELVQIIKDDPNRVAAIQKFSLKQIYKIMKSIGYKSDIGTLATMLNNLGIRKKQEVKWLSGKDNFKKCKCGGQIIKIRRIMIELIGQKKFGYEQGECYKLISNSPNKNSVYYELDKILKKFGLEKYYYCNDCQSYFIVEKEKGKRVFKNNEKLKKFNSEGEKVINIITDEFYQKLSEFKLDTKNENTQNNDTK